MQLERIQQALSDEGLAGWLFYDFRQSNPIAYQVLGLPTEDMYTRRWFYFIPAHGTPSAIISAVESHVLRSLPGERRIFRTWQEMQDHLKELLRPGTRIAMEYSPRNAIPYMSRVDGGTLELVRSYGVDVVSSANIAQRFVAQLSDEQVEMHREAGRRIIAAKDSLFAELSSKLRAGEPLDEYRAQQRFLELLEQAGVVASLLLSIVPFSAGTSSCSTSGPICPAREQYMPTIHGWPLPEHGQRSLPVKARFLPLCAGQETRPSPSCASDCMPVRR